MIFWKKLEKKYWFSTAREENWTCWCYLVGMQTLLLKLNGRAINVNESWLGCQLVVYMPVRGVSSRRLCSRHPRATQMMMISRKIQPTRTMETKSTSPHPQPPGASVITTVWNVVEEWTKAEADVVEEAVELSGVVNVEVTEESVGRVSLLIDECFTIRDSMTEASAANNLRRCSESWLISDLARK